MASANKVILVGNLTRDPELKQLPSGTSVVSLGIATNRKWKNNDGSQGEEVTFIDCEMFGKRAEILNQYAKKGDPLYIEGRLKFDTWQGQDGSNRSKLSVFILDFQFLQGGNGGNGNGNQNQNQNHNNNNNNNNQNNNNNNNRNNNNQGGGGGYNNNNQNNNNNNNNNNNQNQHAGGNGGNQNNNNNQYDDDIPF